MRFTSLILSVLALSVFSLTVEGGSKKAQEPKKRSQHLTDPKDIEAREKDVERHKKRMAFIESEKERHRREGKSKERPKHALSPMDPDVFPEHRERLKRDQKLREKREKEERKKRKAERKKQKKMKREKEKKAKEKK